MLTFIRYIEVYFKFAFLDCGSCNEDFFKSWFCSIYFIVIFPGLKTIVLYNESGDFLFAAF